MPKCYWCKEPVFGKDIFTYEHVTRNNTIILRRGHKECYLKVLENKESKKQEEDSNAEFFYSFRDLLLKIFGLDQLSNVHFKHYHSYVKQGYDNEMIYNALLMSEDAIYRNLDKPWNYHSAIIQNHLGTAKIKVEKERQRLEEKIQLEQVTNKKITIIKHIEKEHKGKSILDKSVDMSTL